MHEEEIKELKRLLLNLDRKMDHMIEKIDRIMEKIDLVADADTSKPETKGNGWRVIEVDGNPQVISWDLQDFDDS